MNNRNGVIVQFDVMTDLKLECPMRNKQGNCCPVGGFCADTVPDEICKAVRSAYERGYSDAVTYISNEYVTVPFSWLVKFCTHIDFKEPLSDAERKKLWRKKAETAV